MKFILTLIISGLLYTFYSQGLEPFSKVQKKNQSLIVFSNEEIIKNQENEDLFITEWNMGEPLYYRAYMDNSIMGYVAEYKKKMKMGDNEIMRGVQALVMKINGKEMYVQQDAIPGKYMTSSVTFGGQAFVENEHRTHYIGNALSGAFRALDKDLKPGQFIVDFETYIISSQDNNKDVKKRIVLASTAKLKVNVTETGIEKFKILLCEQKSTKAMDDSLLEKKVLEQFNDNGGNGTRCYITCKDWIIKRNTYGVILYKYLKLTVVYINEEGLAEKRNITARKVYDGTSYSSKLSLHANGGKERVSVHCLHD